MPVNTKKVQGRRDVHYDSLDELMEEASRLANDQNAVTLGNWSQGRIYDHLTKSFNGSIDGMGFAMPAPARFIFSKLMKKRFLTKGLPSGFKTKPHLEPPQVPAEQGLEDLRKAIERLQQEDQRAMHPIFGHISKEEWDQFHLRHAEMHMSFIVENNGDSKPL